MLDFTNLPTKKKAYGGANGSKLSVIYNDELYMLKLPMHALKNPNLSYTNSCTSEYLGCHIFNMLGIKAQETLLGTYKYHDKVKIVVACKDFTSPGVVILDFASIKNQIIDSASNGYGTELSDIIDTINKQTVVDSEELKEHFWNMFVVDAFIGNWDRHNGNWGFLYNQETDKLEIAPIFDCGSALFPQIDDELIKKVISSKAEMNARVYDIPTSAILIDGKRANYHKVIISLEYKDCNKAIKRIVPKIQLDDINKLIDNVEELSQLKKEFLKKILKLRKELILDAAFKKL
ncbi:MAG: HipA domain-containing protein [Candidatus Onthovivens sp.]|nr:HipA domain-containing protein [Candidatus Onthovivens sp.]